MDPNRKRWQALTGAICLGLLVMGCGGIGAQKNSVPENEVAATTTTAAAPRGVTAMAPTAVETPVPVFTATMEAAAAPEPTPDRQNAVERIWEKDGMAQVFVPAGEFNMGTKEGEGVEFPIHSVHVDGFWLDKTEATNAMFAKFVQETDYRTDVEKGESGLIWVESEWKEVDGADWRHPQGPSSDLQGKDQRPVVLVSWNDAVAYCAWAGKRLPSEAEWEKAARGTDERLLPWGNIAPTCNMANFGLDKKSFCVGDTTDVGSYPDGAGPYGALDMAGNVWEWVSDWYSPGYYEKSPDQNPAGPEDGQQRAVRGGGWSSYSYFARTTNRGYSKPGWGYDFTGFRCAASEN